MLMKDGGAVSGTRGYPWCGLNGGVICAGCVEGGGGVARNGTLEFRTKKKVGTIKAVILGRGAAAAAAALTAVCQRRDSLRGSRGEGRGRGSEARAGSSDGGDKPSLRGSSGPGTPLPVPALPRPAPPRPAIWPPGEDNKDYSQIKQFYISFQIDALQGTQLVDIARTVLATALRVWNPARVAAVHVPKYHR
ncbi:hypothetical protein E2C01_001471 [Portunus trituberculatus]|uniref:Uncharacterized protein n=1 Tax=Portunus trituberculatus TaxID=210409 RepID=A0A5B7CKI4_PORTR|nr:hypothetical protein [Portunus trituberculatus]